jgi:hypothetical protein
MATRTLEADYLVIGCGAAGMAFTDSLISASPGASVVMVDRRHAPGGHWNDGYPFLRLHQPSSYYGVNSLPLGGDTIDRHGFNEGLYERAGAAEICGYYDRVMQQRLLPSGRVRYFPMCDYRGGSSFTSLMSGGSFEVKVKKKLVDATYLQPSIPVSTPPPFEVAAGARCVAVNDLPRMAPEASGYTIIGAGKTAIDACLWLLEIGVPPAKIRWVAPRESWLVNRAFVQGGELVGNFIDGLSLQLEAAARATSLENLSHGLEEAGYFMRLDKDRAPTKFTMAIVTGAELAELARIGNIVRMGHVRRIERDAIVLDEGTVRTAPGELHVHCAARGLNPAPSIPIFSDDRTTLQPIRTGLIPFNAALVAYIEATREDTTEKNRLCPSNPFPQVPVDWVRGTLIQMDADYRWAKEPDIAEWLEASRLNIGRGLRRRAAEPKVQKALERFADNIRPGLAKLAQFSREHS